MPGPSRWRGPALLHAVASNKVKTSKLNERVRAVLTLINLTTKSGIPENATESKLDREEDRHLIRRVGGESIVLLKNRDNVLPLSKSKRIAVIGPNSKIAAISGGGSASLNPYYTVTPYEGIEAKANSGIDFAQGVYGHLSLPQLGKRLHTVDGSPGFKLKVYNEPAEFAKRDLLEERHLTESNMFFIDYNHPRLSKIWYADAEGIFTPEETGTYDFGVCVQGTARMYIDGELIISNVENQKSGPSFLGAGTIEEVGHKDLVAGTQYRILVQWGCAKTSKMKTPGVLDFGHGGFSFGGCKRLYPEESIEAAVELARTTDQVVIIAGLSSEWETEGQDRETMALPPKTDELIMRVLQANPNTVVVIQSGTPVLMPWIDQAKAVLHAWYGGNETGNAIADILYGDVNPVCNPLNFQTLSELFVLNARPQSGKLPLTIPRRIEDNPAYLNYRSEGGRTLYGEDVYVGYRYFDKVKIAPLFPFGHGLSYTSFKFADLKVQKQPENETKISVTVSNTGSCAGAEVIQVYISPVKPRINRPPKELKGFKKVFLPFGAEERVDVVIDLVQATSFWDEYEEKWCSAAGVYKILVGNSSDAEILQSELVIDKTVYWLGL
jgi:beta-glucosidase